MRRHGEHLKQAAARVGGDPRPSRPFVVRWQDEDSGWHNATVLAADEDQAREAVEATVGHVEQVIPLPTN